MPLALFVYYPGVDRPGQLNARGEYRGIPHAAFLHGQMLNPSLTFENVSLSFLPSSRQHQRLTAPSHRPAVGFADCQQFVLPLLAGRVRPDPTRNALVRR